MNPPVWKNLGVILSDDSCNGCGAASEFSLVSDFR